MRLWSEDELDGISAEEELEPVEDELEDEDFDEEDEDYDDEDDFEDDEEDGDEDFEDDEEDIESLAYLDSLDEEAEVCPNCGEEVECDDDFDFEGCGDQFSCDETAEDDSDFDANDVKAAVKLVSYLKRFAKNPKALRRVLKTVPEKVYSSFSRITESVLEQKIGIVSSAIDEDGSLIACLLEDIPTDKKAKLYIKDIKNAYNMIASLTGATHNVRAMQNRLDRVSGEQVEAAIRIMAAIDIIQNGSTDILAFKKMDTRSYNKRMKTTKKNIAKNRLSWKKAAKKRKNHKHRMKPNKKRQAKLSRTRGRHGKKGTLSKKKTTKKVATRRPAKKVAKKTTARKPATKKKTTRKTTGRKMAASYFGF